MPDFELDHAFAGCILAPAKLCWQPMKTAEIISEIRGLTPEDFAEVSAFILRAEREDPALQVALARKDESAAGRVLSHPYEASRAAALTALRAGR